MAPQRCGRKTGVRDSFEVRLVGPSVAIKRYGTG
jgi:hypothetical protein